MEETGCGTGAVAPAARKSRKLLRFLRGAAAEKLDALTKNLFFQGEACVSPGEIQWPLPKTYFFKGVNYLRMAGWLAGLAGWYSGW